MKRRVEIREDVTALLAARVDHGLQVGREQVAAVAAAAAGRTPSADQPAQLELGVVVRRVDARLEHEAQWGTTFPGAACVVALVDRFAQHCHRVEIIGDSYRDNHRLEPDRHKPAGSKARRNRA